MTSPFPGQTTKTIETRKSPSYLRLEERWQEGRVVILDGGVGSELEVIGYPSERNIDLLWGTRALVDAPELTKEVHRRYVRSGADVITTNTWRIDSIPRAQALGLIDSSARTWRDAARLAVELAREAVQEQSREGRCAIAFSMFMEPIELDFLPELAETIGEVEPDLILVETTETIHENLEFPEYEILLATGLPLWVSYRWCATGPCDVRNIGIEPHHGLLQQDSGELFGRAARKFEEMGISAVLINCLPRDRVPGTLPLLRRFTNLPLGVYPNVGTYVNPGWQFDETTTPAAYLADALKWREEEGANIIGGCCGTTSEHIAALATGL